MGDRRGEFQSQEPSTDSFLADYLSTLDKQGHPMQGHPNPQAARARKHDGDDGLEEGERQVRRGGAYAAPGGGKPPMPFFKKPTHQPYELGSRGFMHVGYKR